ncbi:MAG: hypothetical protein AAFQ42_06765 [Pseudomonadota bacterium]
MKRFVMVIVGLALISICVAWFTGLFEQAVMTQSAPEAGGAARRARPLQRETLGGLDLNTVLNFVNVLVGAVGLYLTYKAGQSSGRRET